MSRWFPDKARIVKVGTFGPNGEPVGWTFDGRGRRVAAHAIAEDGTPRWGGWSTAELREYAAEHTERA